MTRAYYPHPAPFDELATLAGVNDVLQRSYGKLSGGQQRRVQFALAVCGNPDLLCLDEPTVGLDAAVLAHGRTVMAGTVDEVRALSPGARIRCISRLSTEAVSTWEGVEAVVRDGPRLQIETAVPECVMRRLLEADALLSECCADAFRATAVSRCAGSHRLYRGAQFGGVRARPCAAVRGRVDRSVVHRDLHR